ncbi:hypothetical protein GLA29479_2264 [Lysobacter antibioticus]|uniref:Uncharacterized protein n=1 Tax=Lysobacter antibioticus TaxID=84531 RepID=A0A0S2DXF8_LYSAN|nr:hypothetical protein GLA29479_2264 [Lysobacter antibioticus]ALN82440.1 hypothetical protein LA76x_4329 [Lysobacter antibioticus]
MRHAVLLVRSNPHVDVRLARRIRRASLTNPSLRRVAGMGGVAEK